MLVYYFSAATTTTITLNWKSSGHLGHWTTYLFTPLTKAYLLFMFIYSFWEHRNDAGSNVVDLIFE